MSDFASFRKRLDLADELLLRKGLFRRKPFFSIHRLLWSMSIPIRPPLFAGFLYNLTFCGLFFGVLLGTFMWFSVWSRHDMPITSAIYDSAVAGLIFGILAAICASYLARKYNLPAWEKLSSDMEVLE